MAAGRARRHVPTNSARYSSLTKTDTISVQETKRVVRSAGWPQKSAGLREEVRAFLAGNAPSPADLPRSLDARIEALRGWQAQLLPSRVRRPGVAPRVRRRRPGAGRADRRRPGTGGRRGTGVRQRRRARRSRPVAAALRYRKAAPAAHPADPGRHPDLVPGLLRARGGFGPGLTAYQGSDQRWPFRAQRAKDLGVVGPVRPVVWRAGQDRGPGLRAATPPWHFHADRRHELSGRGRPADDADHRARGVLRAVLRRRAGAGGEPAQRPGRRLEDRHVHARARARDRGAPPPGQVAHVARPAGNHAGRPAPRREGPARRSGAPRSRWRRP